MIWLLKANNNHIDNNQGGYKMGAIKAAHHGGAEVVLKKEDILHIESFDLVRSLGCLQQALDKKQSPNAVDFKKASKALFHVFNKIEDCDHFFLENDDLNILESAPCVLQKAYNETKGDLDTECNETVSDFIAQVTHFNDKQLHGCPKQYVCGTKKLTK